MLRWGDESLTLRGGSRFWSPCRAHLFPPLPNWDLDNLVCPMGAELGGSLVRASVSPTCKQCSHGSRGLPAVRGPLGEEEQRSSVAIPHGCQSQPFLGHAFTKAVIDSSPTRAEVEQCCRALPTCRSAHGSLSHPSRTLSLTSFPAIMDAFGWMSKHPLGELCPTPPGLCCQWVRRGRRRLDGSLTSEEHPSLQRSGAPGKPGW